MIKESEDLGRYQAHPELGSSSFTLHRSQERGLFHHHPEDHKLPPTLCDTPHPAPLCSSAPPSYYPHHPRASTFPGSSGSLNLLSAKSPTPPGCPAPLCPAPKANPCLLTLWRYVDVSITVSSSLLAYVYCGSPPLPHWLGCKSMCAGLGPIHSCMRPAFSVWFTYRIKNESSVLSAGFRGIKGRRGVHWLNNLLLRNSVDHRPRCWGFSRAHATSPFIPSVVIPGIMEAVILNGMIGEGGTQMVTS